MIYYYHLSYFDKKDEFFGYVDDGTRAGNCIFQINDTQEIIDYIKTGRMKHIDDIIGLAAFLKAQDLMKPDDTLILCEEQLW